MKVESFREREKKSAEKLEGVTEEKKDPHRKEVVGRENIKVR